MLVLGGTVFLSKAVATEALRRGHTVRCAARGRSGTVPEGAELVVVDRDEPGALDGLRGMRLDAVVDVAMMSLRWVRDALAALASTTVHWTFVSTVNVYADLVTPGQRADAALLQPHLEDTELDLSDIQRYGAVKVAGEDAVRAALPEGAFVVRPGLITGPGDRSDRFGYWPARLARGGQAVVPDAPEQPVQYVDVRDLAAWIVDAAEQRITGDFDGTGPVVPLPELLRGIADAVGAPDLELVAQPAAALEAAGIARWGGPRSLPLWVPPTHWGIISRDAGPAAAAGLRHRDLADAAADALTHERELGLDRERKAGLTPAEEAELLGRAVTLRPQQH